MNWYQLVELEQSGEEISAGVVTASDSPWYSGHFPDNPILPGIAQLEMVRAVVARARREALVPMGVSRVKFRKLVRPGEKLTLYAAAKKEHQYQFKITSQGQDVCSGIMILLPESQT